MGIRIAMGVDIGGEMGVVEWAGTLAAGAALSFLVPEAARRPRLTVVSEGGGGAIERSVFFDVANKPARIGCEWGPTVLLGRRVLGDVRFGVDVARNTASCHAWLTSDPDPGTDAVPLYFEDAADPGKPAQFVRLESGTSARLYVFARLERFEGAYFAAQPAGGDSWQIRVPDESRMWSGTRKFIIHVKCTGRARPQKIRVEIYQRLDGMLEVVTAGGRGSF